MIDPTLQRARLEGTPLIDGDTATFVWHGRRAPQLIGDFNEWGDGPAAALTRTAPGVWTCRLELPADAYIEYAYADGHRRLADPLNRHTTPSGLGAANHWFYMPGARPTPLARRRRHVPRGEITRHSVPTDDLVAGHRRTVYLYRPPCPGPHPLLVVWDGPDYLRRADLPQIVDNLVAQGHIRPLALALVANGGRWRGIEYACSEATLGFLQYQVLPIARRELDLVGPGQQPGAYGILGASMGGLQALYTGLRLPQVFGRVLSQSGAFGSGEHDFVVYDLAALSHKLPLCLWLDVGRYESLLGANRRMVELLAGKGYNVGYREYNRGHNYAAWRDDLWRGLELLFPA